jgi:glyoxylase-like metal-dependent hydrolase (beta-lactamase superfamily II)
MSRFISPAPCRREGREIDRRAALKLGAGSLAALAVSGLPLPARALGRLSLGDAELTIVSDGTLTLPMDFAFPDPPRDALAQLLSAHGLATDALTPDCNVTILRRGDRVALFDAGSGSNFMPTAGRLLDNLAEAGIDPEAVTDIVLTHAHPDHIWGVTDDFDDLAFPNAGYMISHAEWDFWSSDDAMSQVAEARQSFVVGAQNRFAAIGERVRFVKPGEEVLPGVEAVDTAGHTPGHLSYLVRGGGDTMLVAGDALTNVAISFARPDWPSGTDQDKALGIETRLKLLDRLASEKTRIIGYHLPHPGAGTVERKDGAYRFVPA